jgi:hypothetical protein
MVLGVQPTRTDEHKEDVTGRHLLGEYFDEVKPWLDCDNVHKQ